MLLDILPVLAYLYFSSLVPWLVPLDTLGLDATLILTLAEPLNDLVVPALSFTKHVQLIDGTGPAGPPPGTVDWFDSPNCVTYTTTWSWLGIQTTDCVHPEALAMLSATNTGLPSAPVLTNSTTNINVDISELFATPFIIDSTTIANSHPSSSPVDVVQDDDKDLLYTSSKSAPSSNGQLFKKALKHASDGIIFIVLALSILHSFLAKDGLRRGKDWMKTFLGITEIEIENAALSSLLGDWEWRIQEQAERLTESQKECVKAAEAVDATLATGGADATADALLSICDDAKAQISGTVVMHVDREALREAEVMALAAYGDGLSNRLNALHARYTARRRESDGREEGGTARILDLMDAVEATEAKLEIVEARSDAYTQHTASLEDALAKSNLDKGNLEAANQMLRDQYTSMQQERLRRKVIRQAKVNALKAAKASKKAQLQVVEEQVAAEVSRAERLELAVRSADTEADHAEDALRAELSHKQEQVSVVATSLADMQAKTAALARSHEALVRTQKETADGVETLKARVRVAQDTVAQAHYGLCEDRRRHMDELSCVTQSSAALRSARDVKMADIDTAKADLQRSRGQQDVEVAEAQATLDTAAADNAKASSALEKKARKQAENLVYLDRKHNDLQAQHNAVDSERDALQARINEESAEWAETRQEMEDLEAQRAEDLRTYQVKWDDAEVKRVVAEEAARVAMDAAVEAETKSEADSKQTTEMREQFNVELRALRTSNVALASTKSSLMADHDALKADNDTLRDRAATLPERLRSGLEELSAHMESLVSESAAQLAKRKVSPVVRQRTLEIENAQDTVELLQATAEGLEETLSGAHVTLFEERKKLDEAVKGREAVETKVGTLQGVLATPTPSLVNSSGRFSRSPSLTPPPETPVVGSGRPPIFNAGSLVDMDIVDFEKEDDL